MSKVFRLLFILVILSLLAGCLPGPAAPGSQKAIRSEKERAEASQAQEGDIQNLAAGNNAFALDLYRQLNAGGQEFFYSPYSISLALAMTYAGAREETARQMAEALHFTLPGDQLHPAFNALDQELAKRKDSGGQGADGKGFRLNIVNDIWGQEGYTFQPEFLDLLAMNYGSGLRQMNFKGSPEEARKSINDYIAEKTEKRIKDLVPPGMIDPMTRLVLTNAIYFNAAWKYTFDKEQTKNAPFTRLDGSKVDVPLMKHSTNYHMAYLAAEGFKAIALPYENDELSMLLLVPDNGRFAEFEAGLDAAKLESILGEMKFTNARVVMPSFEMESSFSLKKELSGMGMVEAFEGGKANFSGMDGTRDLYIDDVIHKSFVKVDEQGTEAAAATMVAMPAMAAPTRPVELIIDRPFIFLIRDQPTNTILFMGKVLDPSK